MSGRPLRAFFLPSPTKGFLLRAAVVAVLAFVLFRYVLIPFRIHGHSMAPTYRNGGVNFCNTLAYAFSPPKRFDVVAIRMAGPSVMLLKRVVALPGESIAFKKGGLYINDRSIAEPYVSGPWEWRLAARTVKPGHVYVVGDNRNVPMDAHVFGQTPIDRIIGAPLW